jgi:murein DD-endopeptidase MepM/ murein hydrolase activator NlpD
MKLQGLFSYNILSSFGIVPVSIALLLSACVPQNPAPIEFKEGVQRRSNKPYNYYPRGEVIETSRNSELTSKPLKISYEDYDKTMGELKNRSYEQDPLETSRSDNSINKKTPEEDLNIELPGNKVEEIKSSRPYQETSSSLAPVSNSFIMPVAGTVLVNFGEELSSGGKSNGIEIGAEKGSKISSVSSGVVIYSGFDERFGNLMIVKMTDSDLYVAYAHMDDLLLNKGDTVSKGQIIGHVGDTGIVDQPKLYLAVRQNKISVDPRLYIK